MRAPIRRRVLVTNGGGRCHTLITNGAGDERPRWNKAKISQHFRVKMKPLNVLLRPKSKKNVARKSKYTALPAYSQKSISSPSFHIIRWETLRQRERDLISVLLQARGEERAQKASARKMMMLTYSQQNIFWTFFFPPFPTFLPLHGYPWIKRIAELSTRTEQTHRAVFGGYVLHTITTSKFSQWVGDKLLFNLLNFCSSNRCVFLFDFLIFWIFLGFRFWSCSFSY